MMKTLAIGLMTATAAFAQTWTGEYQWTATDAEKAVIEKAVEDGAQQVGMLVRSVARGRLKESTKPFQKLTFAKTNETVTVVRDDDTPISGVADGTKIEWTRKDKKKFAVQQTLVENVLTQTFTDPDGNTRVNRHVFAEDGKTMSLEITLNSSSLKTPLKYALSYKRPESKK